MGTVDLRVGLGERRLEGEQGGEIGRVDNLVQREAGKLVRLIAEYGPDSR
jgi:hypothetical protein